MPMREDQYFVDALLSWHARIDRNLPWKKNNDPYSIWLSEIILQQTRVDQGIPYFNRMIRSFPTIFDLANSNEDELLKLWEGLGYYTRARNLLVTAKEIVSKYNGKVPDDYNDLIKLQGIGPYTAAAISSFAYGKPRAVLDGNAIRVLCRFFGIEERIESKEGKRCLQEKAQSLIPPEYPALFNQAIMDFGGLMCRNSAPLCKQCPIAKYCVAFQEERIAELPLKKVVRAKRNRFFTYVVMFDKEQILIRKRRTSDIWKGLYEFYLVEEHWSVPFEQLGHIIGIDGNFICETGPFKQTLSHQRVNARFIEAEILSRKHISDDFLSVNKDELRNYPFPKIINLYYLNLLF